MRRVKKGERERRGMRERGEREKREEEGEKRKARSLQEGSCTREELI